MQTMLVEIAGGLVFVAGLLFAIFRRRKTPLKRVAPDLSVSRSWLAEHQARHVGE
jgi:hypothetical protein